MVNAFLKSALCSTNPFNSTDEIIKWLIEQNKKTQVHVSKIHFREMKGWLFDENMNLRHESGKFFSIEGIQVTTNWGEIERWEQPIINQPEIGYLGLITKEFDGILYFLLQAKIEPGNVNCVQLSPTLQATKSNYSQVHNGKKPLYLEYFINAKKEQILLDQLQSEQGARFLRKRNRNIIIKVDEKIPIYDNFIWLTLSQIKELAQIDNMINMDTRTVISGIPMFSQSDDSQFVCEADGFEEEMLKSCMASKSHFHTRTEILSWFTSLKCKYELSIVQKPLKNIHDWIIESNCIRHRENKFFKVIAAEVSISNREVTSWCQPLVQPVQQGLVAFIVKKINGIMHFLVQAKLECGNLDILEMAPTVQCITGSYSSEEELPFLRDVMNAKPEQIRIDTLQSEEGGRFYHEQNRNLIIEVDDDFPVEVPENYTWMTLNQLIMFLEFNNYLNIQARSLISLINFNN